MTTRSNTSCCFWTLTKAARSSCWRCPTSAALTSTKQFIWGVVLLVTNKSRCRGCRRGLRGALAGPYVAHNKGMLDVLLPPHYTDSMWSSFRNGQLLKLEKRSHNCIRQGTVAHWPPTAMTWMDLSPTFPQHDDPTQTSTITASRRQATPSSPLYPSATSAQ